MRYFPSGLMSNEKTAPRLRLRILIFTSVGPSTVSHTCICFSMQALSFSEAQLDSKSKAKEIMLKKRVVRNLYFLILHLSPLIQRPNKYNSMLLGAKKSSGNRVDFFCISSFSPSPHQSRISDRSGEGASGRSVVLPKSEGKIWPVFRKIN